MKNWDQQKKLEYDMKLMQELQRNYNLVCKLFIVCLKRGLKLIMENPYSDNHFLKKYLCIPAAIIDSDRRQNGDYFKKPTQYWFIGIEPKFNFLLEPIKDNSISSSLWAKNHGDYKETGAKSRQVARSMIHPDYANRFIRQYILEE